MEDEGKDISRAGKLIIHCISGCCSFTRPNLVAQNPYHEDPGLDDKTQQPANLVKNFLAFVAIVLKGKNRW